ncbi:MAG: hypothetical protein OQK71_03785, partial [Desulfobacter sp.]|nr:hypothetical protein [Desulfobacter sp.]
MYSCQSQEIVSVANAEKYKSYTLRNYRNLRQIDRLSEDQKFAIDVVARVLPFKTNNYVVNELIDWDKLPNDPIFILNFPQRGMLHPHHFNKMAKLLKRGASKKEITDCAN